MAPSSQSTHAATRMESSFLPEGALACACAQNRFNSSVTTDSSPSVYPMWNTPGLSVRAGSNPILASCKSRFPVRQRVRPRASRFDCRFPPRLYISWVCHETRHIIMKAWRNHAGSTVIIFLLVVALWGYVVGPLVATFQQSITGPGGGFEPYRKFIDFRSGALGESMLGSLIISFLSVITSGVTGVFLAVLLKRWDFPIRRVCQVLVLVPIALPPLMGVEAFVLLYGIGGTFPQLFADFFHTNRNTFAVDGISGVLLVHTLTMYPYFYLTVAAALEQSDDSLEEAAYSLGASKFKTWTRVLLPMLTPAIVAGSLLTF